MPTTIRPSAAARPPPRRRGQQTISERALVACCLGLACLAEARAAAMRCEAAASVSERAICATPALLQLDGALAASYASLLGALPAEAADLRRQQREWLQARDACGADVGCLTRQYQMRLNALRMPDADDMAALETLRQAIDAARRTDPEFPLEKALASFKITTGMTTFANEERREEANAETDNEAGNEARFPRGRPPGVSEPEWSALLASDIEGGGERGTASYTLMDLDGDGKRDLVIQSYVGGTGLFSQIGILRQEGGRFVVPGMGVVTIDPASPDLGTVAALYLLNDRGSDASATWVRLRGRVYAVYRDGTYGMDAVSLLRPWGSRNQVPRLNVRYRYRLSVIPEPKHERASEQPAARPGAALLRALNTTVAEVARTVTAAETPRTAPICPLPANAPAEVREFANSYGAGHYSYEVVADVPVQVGRQCWVGRVRDWFGRYTAKDGLYAELCMRKPEDTAPEGETCYDVRGRRTATAVDSVGMAPFER